MTRWSQNVVLYMNTTGYILRLPQDIQYCMIGIVQIETDICGACHDFMRAYMVEYDDCCIR